MRSIGQRMEHMASVKIAANRLDWEGFWPCQQPDIV